MRRILDYPPVWLVLFALPARVLAWLAPVPTLGGAGWVLVGVAVALMTAAALTMLRGGATLDPTRKPTGLITHGIFRWSRNPIYLADAIILTGLCLMWWPAAALVLVPGFLALVTRRFIHREEAWLSERDPDAFAAWAARTRRWV